MEIHVQQDPKVQLRRIQAQPVLVLPAQATSHPRVLRYPLSRGKSPLTPNYYHPESLLLTDAIPRHKPHQTWEKLFRQTTTLRCRGSPELHTLFPYASQRPLETLSAGEENSIQFISIIQRVLRRLIAAGRATAISEHYIFYVWRGNITWVQRHNTLGG